MKTRFAPILRTATFAVSSVLALGTGAHAAIFNWDGGAGTSNWTDANNWNPDGAQAPLGISDAHRLNINSAQKLIYDYTTAPTNYTGDTVTGGGRGLVIASGSNARGELEITAGTFSTLGATAGDVIGNVAGAIGTLTINGGHFIGTTAGTGLGIGGGPTSTLNVSSGSATLANLNLNATTATVNLSGTGVLAVNNITRSTGNTANINFDGGTLMARINTTAFLNGLNAATINSGGVTVDSNSLNITIAQSLLGGAGSGGLTKTGAGILTLSGTNTHTGPTTLTQGTISVGSNANLGADTSNLVFDGGTLQITGSTLTSISGLGRTVTFNAGKDVGIDIAAASNTFTVDQVLNQSTGGFTKLGAGKVIFTQANTYTGDTTISAGALIRQVADTTTGDISVANGASFVLDGGITDGAGQSLSLNGPGSNSGGYFYVGSAIQRGSLQAHNGANTWAGDIILNGTGNTRIGVQDGASLTLTGNITESVAGAGVLFRAGSLNDDIIVSGTGSWTGVTTLFSNGGSIRITADDRLSTSASVLFTSGGSTVLDLNGFNQEFAGIDSITTNITIRSGVSGTSILTSNTPDALTFNNQGVITDGSGTVSFVKRGTGTQNLTNINTYTGSTTITAGTLALTGSGSINDSSLIDVQASATLSIAGVNSSTTIGNDNPQTLRGLGTVDLGTKTLNIGSFGILAPGSGPGTLQFASTTGILNFATESTIAFDLGTTSDLISFISAGDWLSGSGNATLALNLLAGFDYEQTYTIFRNVTTSDFAFANITGYDTAEYSASFEKMNDDYTLRFIAIPEPASTLLGCLGLLALLRRRRA
jgi:fibronectin-binding autotransporter adhesin